MRRGLSIVVACLTFAFLPKASALILYGYGNGDSLITSAPTGASDPWSAVGRLTNASGTLTEASGIYLGNGYVLTAQHVSTGSVTNVQFSTGGPSYAIDTTYGFQQVAANVDLKVFRLQDTNPVGVTPVNLWTDPTNFGGSSLLIGWGNGRNPSVATQTASVAWGADSTAAKRWARNSIDSAANGSTDVAPYTNDILYSSTGLPANIGSPTADELLEGSLTVHDSGGGVFQNISGTWYLVGVMEATTSGGTTTFGADTDIYVRVNSYADEIQSLIAIPEPSTIVLTGLGGLILLAQLRRKYRQPS